MFIIVLYITNFELLNAYSILFTFVSTIFHVFCRHHLCWCYHPCVIIFLEGGCRWRFSLSRLTQSFFPNSSIRSFATFSLLWNSFLSCTRRELCSFMTWLSSCHIRHEKQGLLNGTFVISPHPFSGSLLLSVILLLT